jgi:predicted ribosome quality control (RQC) complex YloA/Tae2 family protein
MALDGAFLYAVKDELEILKGARVDKIHQPSREEIIINMRTNAGAKKLYMSSSADSARVHITEMNVDNPKVPPMFCMLLRKHLSGGKLIDIRQDGLERILFFDFECTNELGDKVIITIACEIMGRHSNIIIISQEGRIIDSIKRVDAEMSRERLVLPNMIYELPPRTQRVNFIKDSVADMINAIKNAKPAELSKVLMKTFEGISPIVAREWAFYTSKGSEIYSSDLTDEHFARLMFIIKMSADSLLMNAYYDIVKDKNGLLKDFSFIRISQYGNLMITSKTESACKTLDMFYYQRDNMSRLKQRANDLFKLLSATTDRISKRIANQQQELEQCAEKDTWKLYGDLISSNIYRLEKGMEYAVVENFYDENYPQISIKMDVRKTPSQNAQHYYNEYRKAVTAEKKLAEQIKLGREELEYIDSVFDALTRTESETEVIELRLELMEQGYIKSRLKGKPPKPQKPFEYVSSDGYTIFAGRNNKQNDKLTLKTAEKNDIWCHTQNITGSHVIIVTNGETPPDRTIEEACIIASYNSRGRESSQVPVDYCLARYVKKPNGAKPGMVIFTNYKTAYITPDKDLIERLRVK